MGLGVADEPLPSHRPLEGEGEDLLAKRETASESFGREQGAAVPGIGGGRRGSCLADKGASCWPIVSAGTTSSLEPLAAQDKLSLGVASARGCCLDPGRDEAAAPTSSATAEEAAEETRLNVRRPINELGPVGFGRSTFAATLGRDSAPPSSGLRSTLLERAPPHGGSVTASLKKGATRLIL